MNSPLSCILEDGQNARKKTQIWVCLASLSEIYLNSGYVALLQKELSAEILSDTVLMPGKDRSAADMFNYARRLDNRSMEDRLRGAPSSVAFFKQTLKLRNYKPGHGRTRLPR